MTPYQEWVWKTAADIARWHRNLESIINDYIIDSHWHNIPRYHETVLEETKHSPTLGEIERYAGPLAHWNEIRKYAVYLAMQGDLKWATDQLLAGKKRWAPREW